MLPPGCDWSGSSMRVPHFPLPFHPLHLSANPSLLPFPSTHLTVMPVS